MKHAKLMLIAIVLAAFCSISGAQDVGALIAQIQGPDEAQRMAAVEALASARLADAIGPLFGLLEGANRDADVAARLAIARIVYRASAPNTANRSAVASALAQVAASPGRVGVRRHALRMVSFVGRDEVVPVLTALLKDHEVREMARWALLRIPGDKVTQAFLKAVPAASGEFKAGLINALAARGTVLDSPVVGVALRDKDEAVRIAAIEALGRIPDRSSEPFLREALTTGSARERAAASDAYLHLAEALLAAGQAEHAAPMFQRRYRDALTEQGKCAALGGLAKAGGDGAVPVLLKAVSGRQKTLAGVAAASLAAIPGGDATREIARALPSAGPEVRLRLISILGQRRDLAGVPSLLVVAQTSQNLAERAAALAALGEVGSPAAMPALVSAVRSRHDTIKNAAINSLAQLPGGGATDAIAAAVKTAPAAARPLLIQVLGYRRDRQATPALIAAMKVNSRAVRLAAIEAAGRLDDPAAIPELLRAVSGPSGPEPAEAAIALGHMRANEARQAMVAALPGQTPTTRYFLLVALGIRPDPELLPVFVSAASDPDDEVAKQALIALARLGDDRAAPIFIQAFRTRSPRLALIAAAGYLAVSSNVLDSDRETAIAMARRALEGLSGDDRRLPLQAIARLRDAGSLPLVEPLLVDREVGGDAARALIAIADGLAASDKQQAIMLYKQALAHASDAGLVRDAVKKLREQGVDIDPAADAGFVTSWWVIGPFPHPKRLTKSDVIQTGGPVDVSASVQDRGKTFEWRAVRVDDPAGMLDLEQAVAQQDDCGAYAYAEITVDAARDVLLKIGSDDDVVCWLNGKQVHAHWGGRGYSPDQDVVPASLRAGTNTILLKVLDQGGAWAAGMRITDASGRVIGFQQRKP